MIFLKRSNHEVQESENKEQSNKRYKFIKALANI